MLDAGRVHEARRAEFAHMSEMGVVSDVRRSQVSRESRVVETRRVDNERVGDQVRRDFITWAGSRYVCLLLGWCSVTKMQQLWHIFLVGHRYEGGFARSRQCAAVFHVSITTLHLET